jgi:hypothetical protein
VAQPAAAGAARLAPAPAVAMETVSLILFAVQCALKLGAQARQAYVDSTIGAALVLPLPNFATDFTVEQAVARFRTTPQTSWPPGAVALMTRLGTAALTPDEQQRLVLLALEAQLADPDTFKTIQPLPDGTFLTPAAIRALVQIRQWSSADNPNPTPLQRIAGTLFQIGVDYFATVPGGMNLNSSQGRIVHALLATLDTVDFATVDLRSKTALQDLPLRLFVATADTIAAQPGWYPATCTPSSWCRPPRRLWPPTPATASPHCARRARRT